MKRPLLLITFLLSIATTQSHAQAALNFDGDNDYIQIPNPILTTTAFTIEYWMRTTQTGGSGSTQWYNGIGLVDGEMPGGVNDFGTSLDGTKLAFGIGNPDLTIISTSDVNTGTWVHVAAEWDGTAGTMKLYINGTQETSALSGVSTFPRNATTNIKMGVLQTIVNGYYNGDIDEVRIWDVTRLPSEIQSDMHSTATTATGLVAYYNFNNGIPNSNNTAITTIPDSTGNGHTGTPYNFAMTGTFSNFVGQNLIITLPVTLSSFTGILQNGVATLKWHTEVEDNFERFEIQKSTDGISFQTEGKIATKGNNSDYTFQMKQTSPAAYYRLKMVNYDGSFAYSLVVPLSQKINNQIVIYPNPSSSYIFIRESTKGEILIFDITGKMVQSQSLHIGLNKINIQDLAEGEYICTVNGTQLKFTKD